MEEPVFWMRMKPAHLQRLLDLLDAQTKAPVEQRRGSPRIPCRRTGMVITFDQGGYSSTFVIPVRNISRGGIGFLHRSMLHNSTRCHIRIRTPQKNWLDVWGSVVRARQVSGGVCEVGVKFDQEVDISAFETEAAALPPLADPVVFPAPPPMDSGPPSQ